MENKLIKVTQSLNSNLDTYEEIGTIDFVPTLHSYLDFGNEDVYQVKAVKHVFEDDKVKYSEVLVVEVGLFNKKAWIALVGRA